MPEKCFVFTLKVDATIKMAVDGKDFGEALLKLETFKHRVYGSVEDTEADDAIHQVEDSIEITGLRYSGPCLSVGQLCQKVGVDTQSMLMSLPSLRNHILGKHVKLRAVADVQEVRSADEEDDEEDDEEADEEDDDAK